jgi:transposase-like protein
MPTSAAARDLHQSIRAAIASGARQADLVRSTGLSRAQVSRIARGASSGRQQLPPAQHVVDTLPADEVIARYRSGASARAIGETYGCSASTILAVLRRHQVQRRVARRIELSVSTAEIVRRYRDERQEIQAIAADLGATPHLISRRLAEGGIKVPVGQRPMSLPDAEIRRRHKEGETIVSLAAAFGVSGPTIKRRVREGRTQNSVPRRTVSPPRPNRRLDLPEEEICRRYGEGESMMSLARSFEVSGPTIMRRLRENGVQASS